MDGNSAACEPLLSSEFNDKGYVKKTTLFKPLIKWILKILMWGVFIAWIAIIFLYPGGEFFHDVFESWVDVTSKTPFGETGSYFLLFSAPLLIIAVLAIFHLIIFGEDEDFLDKNSLKQARFRLWTFPVLVDGRFGVVSAAELIGIILVLSYVIWATLSYAVYDHKLIKRFKLPPEDQNLFMLELTASRMGNIGLFCMAFLFLPISRGSVLLRLVDIPFEHATRYHVWLGHLTMVLFTLHGLLFVIAWDIQGTLYEKIISWRNDAFAYLPGVISLLAGLLMWVTSMPPVRKMNFELFFYTHQLYVVFVVFLAMHVGDFIFSIASGGIFLFTLDRFLRFCQSRRTVKVISAKCLPCGTMELVFSKPKDLRYNALSFIFLQVRELSWLQWHPFSVSSSPLDGPNHVAVLIKVLGGWTEKLKQTILSINEAEPTSVQPLRTQAGITASVEGPYGHELPYHLMYENLILVAGGIGISPFLAIISDILHRIREGKPCSPRNVVIVWAIKRSNELPILSTIDMESICPSFSEKLNLSIRIYVTREFEPPLEEGKYDGVPSTSVCPFSKGYEISGLVGTGDNLWSGLYVISSIVGFIILMSLLEIFYINPYGIQAWWYKGLLFMICMLASVILFGGLMLALWHLREKQISEKEVVSVAEKVQLSEPFEYTNQNQKGAGSSTIIHYGSRPDFGEIFRSICEKWGSVDVGVIVCGPETLQSSVAKECRTQTLRRQRHYPVYHFHSHSFNL